MPAGFKKILGPRPPQLVDPGGAVVAKSIAALLRRRTMSGQARLAGRLLADRGFALVVAGTAAPAVEDFDLQHLTVSARNGDAVLLSEALMKRSGPLSALTSGRPRWVALEDDQFQAGAAFLRRFNLAWSLLLPGPGGPRPTRVPFVLVGGTGRRRPDDPALAVLREAAALLAAAGGERPEAPVAGDAPLDPWIWQSAPSALAVVAADEVVTANAEAERLLRESVGRGDGAWRLWLAASTHRLIAGGRAAEILPVTASRDRSLEIRIGEPSGPSSLRVVALRDATAEVAADTRQAETISTLSHELRTPLTALKNGVRLVLGGDAGPLTEQQQRLLELADRNSERLERLLTDLLDAARADAGRLRLNRRSLDLAPLLREALETFTLTIRERDLTVDDSGLPETFSAHVDGDKIVRMVHNVVGNALKYTDPGGYVRIWLQERGTSLPPEAVWLADQFFLPLRTFALVVEDNGRGIAPAVQGRVFEPFSRGDDVGAAAVPGAGLGLHITKSLVEIHGGSIRLASQAGIGTTVWIVLPRDPDSERVLAVSRILAAAAATADAASLQLAALDLRRPDMPFAPSELAAAGRAARRFLLGYAAVRRPGGVAIGQDQSAGRFACCEELAAGLWVGLIDSTEGLAKAWADRIGRHDAPAPLAHSSWTFAGWPAAAQPGSATDVPQFDPACDGAVADPNRRSRSPRPLPNA